MGEAVVLGSLSIFDRVFLGLDEAGEPVNVVLAERNLLVGGEPGAGKSVALNLIVAHAALSLDCRLVLVDGKRVELGVWKQCADTFVGPSIDQAIGVLRDLQAEMDRRYERLLGQRPAQDQPGGRGAGDPGRLRRGGLLLGHGRGAEAAEGVHRAAARPGRPRPGRRSHRHRRDAAAVGRHHPDLAAGPVRLPVGLPLLHRSVLATSSSATAGRSAATAPPTSTRPHRGVGWLIAEGGIPRRVKSAFLSDLDAADLAAYAAKLRGKTQDGAA